MKFKWMFPPTNGGSEQGFNDSSQEIFRDDSLKNAMREIIQNSLDAVDDEGCPVEVSIRTMDVPSSELGAKDLAKHVKEAQAWTKKKHNDDGVQFYEKALSMLRQKSIPVLAITDSNTKGLSEGRWDTLIHEEGTTNKDKSASGGSYGIGKNATYTVSAIKAVGYSTRYLDRRRVEHFIARCKLSAHPDPKDHEVVLQHVGFGTKADIVPNKRAPPTRGPDIYAGFRLKKRGTGVFIIGFEPSKKGWVRKAEHAIARSYFTAIHRKKLHITIDGRYINRDTLDGIFKSDRAGTNEVHYYHIIRDPDIKLHHIKTALGNFTVQVKAVEDDINNVAYVNRRGMLITDGKQASSNPFYKKIGRGWAKYAAVVSSDDDGTDEKIRKMEPPSHDAIRIGLIPADKREDMRDKLREVKEKIAQVIYDELKDSIVQQSVNVAELAGILPHEPDKNGAGQRSRVGALEAVRRIVLDIGVDAGSKNGKGEGKGGKRGKGRDQDRPPIHGENKTPFVKPRVMHNGEKLRVAFTPTVSGKIRFEIKRAGEEKRRQLPMAVSSAMVISPPGISVVVRDTLMEVRLKKGDRFVADLAAEHGNAYTGYQIGTRALGASE